MLRCLNRLERFDEGLSGSVNGDARERVAPLSAAEESDLVNRVRLRVGLVFQNFNLFPHLSALENVIEAPVTVKKMRRSQAIEVGKLYLNLVGLSGKEHEYPARLSGGQQQRVAIARALAMEPDVVLFDEPTSALDPRLVREVATLLRLLDDLKRTLVVVSHDMDFAMAISDQVIYFEGGRAVETGTATGVFGDPSQPETRAFMGDFHDGRWPDDMIQRGRKHIVDVASVLAAGVVLSVVVAEPLPAQSALERVRAGGRLRVGIDATYPPFGIAEGGDFSGFDVDIARAIARELGVEAALVNASFDGVFPALQNGSFDVVISAVTITPERSATLLFSDPYIAAGQQIVVRGDSAIAGPDDLAGRTVGVQINTTAQFSMEKRAGVTIAKYNTIDLALLDLQNGRVDAVASDGPVLRYMVRMSFSGLKTVGAEYTDEQFGVVLARGERRSSPRGQRGALADAGQRRIREASTKWFGESANTRHRSLLPARIRTGPHRADVVLLRARRVADGGHGRVEPVFGLPFGLCLALARVQSSRLDSAPAAIYVEVMRGTPLLVQILFVYFVLPSVGVNLPAYASGVLALTLNAAAYISEVIRAGILSIDAGQMEAARALGMSYWQSMRRIILPQTFRRVVPPLTNEGIALFKDSSLVSVIGLTELARTGQELASRYAAPLTIWPLVALLYLALTFPLTESRSISSAGGVP